MISVLIVLLGCFVISIIVFGGAQIFIPYFKILLVNFLKIENDTWESVLSIANSTPGVFGLKLATVSGFLAGQGMWWSYLLMIATYLIFAIVPISLMFIIAKKYEKVKNNNFMVLFLKMMRPIIAGILVSITLNLVLSILFPFLGFNDLSDNFGKLDKYIYLKNTFFSKWRYWVLMAWTLISIPIDFYIIRKYKTNVILIIAINIALCMILFQPWL